MRNISDWCTNDDTVTPCNHYIRTAVEQLYLSWGVGGLGLNTHELVKLCCELHESLSTITTIWCSSIDMSFDFPAVTLSEIFFMGSNYISWIHLHWKSFFIGISIALWALMEWINKRVLCTSSNTYILRLRENYPSLPSTIKLCNQIKSNLQASIFTKLLIMCRSWRNIVCLHNACPPLLTFPSTIWLL